MAYVQNDNSGSLFKNERKESDKHPDRSGSAMIDGREYWVSGWIKHSDSKGQWLSLSFKPKGEKPTKSTKTLAEDVGDEIPF